MILARQNWALHSSNRSSELLLKENENSFCYTMEVERCNNIFIVDVFIINSRSYYTFLLYYRSLHIFIEQIRDASWILIYPEVAAVYLIELRLTWRNHDI